MQVPSCSVFVQRCLDPYVHLLIPLDNTECLKVSRDVQRNIFGCLWTLTVTSGLIWTSLDTRYVKRYPKVFKYSTTHEKLSHNVVMRGESQPVTRK